MSVENGSALLFYVKHKHNLKQKNVQIQQDAMQFTLTLFRLGRGGGGLLLPAPTLNSF